MDRPSGQQQTGGVARPQVGADTQVEALQVWGADTQVGTDTQVEALQVGAVARPQVGADTQVEALQPQMGTVASPSLA